MKDEVTAICGGKMYFQVASLQTFHKPSELHPSSFILHPLSHASFSRNR